MNKVMEGLKMESLNGMDMFMHVAKTSSFVETGRAKGLSASAVSKSISRLEERLNVRLFQRSTRSVRLTSEGEVFLERCHRIFREIQDAEDTLSLMTQTPHGRLKIGLPLVGELFLPILSAFMQHYPEIELDLDFSDRLSDVIEDGMDVVIRGGDLHDSRLISRRLGSFRLCLAASTEYLNQRSTPIHPDDLSEHTCLHYRYPSSGKIEHWPLKKQRSPGMSNDLPSTMVCSSLEALLFMVKEGRGIACLPDYAIKNSVQYGEVKTVLDTYMTRTSTFHIVWPTTRRMPPKVRVFIDFFIEHFTDIINK